VVHGIWGLLVSSLSWLRLCASESLLAIICLAGFKNFERPIIFRVLALVVHQMLHMLREVLVTIVSVNNITWFVVMYAGLSRSGFVVRDRVARGSQGHREAAQSEENERCDYSLWFHYHRS